LLSKSQLKEIGRVEFIQVSGRRNGLEERIRGIGWADHAIGSDSEYDESTIWPKVLDFGQLQ
jgi:hypothetical protein